MRFNDAVIGIFTILLGVIILIHVQSFPMQEGGRPGPALFPSALSILMIICGLVLIPGGLKSKAPLAQRLPELNAKGITNILLLLAGIVFYVFASETIGFLLTSFLVMLALMYMLKARLKMAIPVAIITTVCIYGIFNKFLMVPLPRGLLSF